VRASYQQTAEGAGELSADGRGYGRVISRRQRVRASYQQTAEGAGELSADGSGCGRVISALKLFFPAQGRRTRQKIPDPPG